MIKKLLQKKGETLVETLVALLIATLSVMMLTTAITTSAQINKKNKDADVKFTNELAEAENYSTPTEELIEKNVEIDYELKYVNSGTTDIEKIVPVNVYGRNGSFASYNKKSD